MLSNITKRALQLSRSYDFPTSCMKHNKVLKALSNTTTVVNPITSEARTSVNTIIPRCFSTDCLTKGQIRKTKFCGRFWNVKNLCSATSYFSRNSSSRTETNSTTSNLGLSTEHLRLGAEMNIRMMNDNTFLSWCRNAYLSTVVGVAMITEGTTTLALFAGAGAFTVGAMNLFWGTGCHIVNMIRLRHITGMSGINLSLNIVGSTMHCFLWLFVVICYVGFLDETDTRGKMAEGDSRVEARDEK